MKPVRALREGKEVERALLGSPAAAVVDLLDRIEQGGLSGPLELAAMQYARASLSLRDGDLDAAATGFEAASAAFTAAGEVESAEIAGLDLAVSWARRGRRELADRARAAATPLVDGGATEWVRAYASIVLGTSERVLGEAGRAQAALFRAVSETRAIPELRTQALSSLGTLSVVLGAFGAAEALLEHAAELCRLRGDFVGEAIAMGQLGAAALGRGDPDTARRALSRQEWLASRVGDAFGRTRALVWLAEVALDLERPDDAVAIAERARASGLAASPPLGTFVAYADRVLGRARLALGEPGGREDLERAAATFRAQGLPLGRALSERDLALGSDPIDHDLLVRALGTLASLGTVDRVLEGLSRAEGAPGLLLQLAAALPKRAEPLEARLVHSDPSCLVEASRPRSAARKNLGRLAVLAFEASPLLVAVVLPRAAQDQGLLAFVDDTATTAAVAGDLGGTAILVWALSAAPELVAADLARARVTLGGSVKVLLVGPPDASVVGPGYGGGLSAVTRGIDAALLIPRASVLAEDAVEIDPGIQAAGPLRAALALAGIGS